MKTIRTIILLLSALMPLTKALALDESDTVRSFPWHEGFETNTAELWILVDNDGNGNNWSVNTANPHDGTRSLVDFYSNSLEDNWAISPALSIPNDADLTLEWYVYAHPNYMESYEVLVTTGERETLGDYSVLFSEDATGGYLQRNISLNLYKGEIIHLAFRYRSENQNFICIDDVTIREKQQNAIAEDMQADVNIYPNPTSGHITVTADGLLLVEITDIQGRIVLSTTSSHIDLKGMPAGVYLLRTVTDKGCVIKKIILTQQ